MLLRTAFTLLSASLFSLIGAGCGDSGHAGDDDSSGGDTGGAAITGGTGGRGGRGGATSGGAALTGGAGGRGGSVGGASGGSHLTGGAGGSGATSSGSSPGGASNAGAPSSAGASSAGAPSGGSSSGGSSGGSSLSVTDVRCFDPTTTDPEQCYGRVAGAWARVYPPCWLQLLADGGSYTPIMGGPSENNCTGTSDDLSAWDEVRCWAITGAEGAVCHFRLGDWWIQAFASCDFYVGVDPSNVTDPGTASCDTPSGTSGWDETRCFDDAAAGKPYCYGRIGQYWFGTLLGDCDIDAFAANSRFTEIPAAQADCK